MPETAKFAGEYFATVAGQLPGGSADKAVATTVYDNTTSTTSLAFSSTDLTMKWGDQCVTVGTGMLDSFKFSVFNSGSSAGTLTGATFRLKFYAMTGTDVTTKSLLGSYDGSITFSTALAKGFYSVITSTGLSTLGINLTSTNLLVTQEVVSTTGAATRLGIVSLNPVVTGSSTAAFYEKGAATTEGFYTSTSGAVNPIYQINTVAVPAPGAVALVGLAGLITGRRRR